VTSPTRIALVDDHALLAEALLLSLAPEGFDVTSVPLTPHREQAELLSAILDLEPQVVLLDLDLGPAGDGGHLIAPLSRARCRVVVLTAWPDAARWGACLASGALTVLTKSTPLQVIVEVIQRVAQGLPVMSRSRREELIDLWRSARSAQDERRSRLERLTPREAQVLGELVQGKRVREVAQDAYVSEATVRTHVKSILAKLGVTSQLAAVVLARDAGWGTRVGTDR
jgi:two-component system, NarL family, nitrate/nitrite response regulator NarL